MVNVIDLVPKTWDLPKEKRGERMKLGHVKARRMGEAERRETEESNLVFFDGARTIIGKCHGEWVHRGLFGQGSKSCPLCGIVRRDE